MRAWIGSVVLGLAVAPSCQGGADVSDNTNAGPAAPTTNATAIETRPAATTTSSPAAPSATATADNNALCLKSLARVATDCAELGKRIVKRKNLGCTVYPNPDPEDVLEAGGFFLELKGGEPRGVKPHLYVPRWFVLPDGSLLTDNGTAADACPKLRSTATVRAEIRAKKQKESGACSPEEIRLARALYTALFKSPDEDEDVVKNRVASKLGVTGAKLDQAYLTVSSRCLDAMTTPQ